MSNKYSSSELITRPLAFEAFNELLDEREIRLLKNCNNYANNDPAGLPGHNLIIIINKLQNALLNPSAAYLVEAIRETLPLFDQFNETPQNQEKNNSLSDFINWLDTDPLKENKSGTVD